jgi:eukaryotic-like serine/threonine-protein kinase
VSQEPGQVIAQKYQLVRRLARGGMGAVWRARHLELESDVALKFVRSDEGIDASKEERFRREARAAAQIRSQHVVHIHDYGVDAGVPYIAMELLSGEDLESYLQRSGRLSLEEAVGLIAQASKGLRAAHHHGVIHRDIKPSNLFIAELAGERLVKVLDFGIAKGAAQKDGDTTTQGQVFGSPAYMSPEQARGGIVDERSDVWSMGAVFYRMVTGKTPFEGANASDIVVNLCTSDATPPSRVCAALGKDVDAFFERALARNVEQRFQSIKDFADAGVNLVNDRVRAPLLKSRDKISGRSDETAPLERFVDPPRTNRDQAEQSSLSFRPSASPGAPVYSGRRGVWAVASVLIALGACGLWIARPKTRTSGGIPSLADQSDSGQDSNLASFHLPPSATVSTSSTTAAESSSLPAGASPEGLRTQESKDSEKSQQAATSPPRRPIASEPQGKAPSPVPSPPSQSPVEKPATDPVFGLPIERP